MLLHQKGTSLLILLFNFFQRKLENYLRVNENFLQKESIKKQKLEGDSLISEIDIQKVTYTRNFHKAK